MSYLDTKMAYYVDHWNSFLWKARAINIQHSRCQGADDLATEAARASAPMVFDLDIGLALSRLNHCWIINWTLWKSFSKIWMKIKQIFIQEDEFENAICKRVAIVLASMC